MDNFIKEFCLKNNVRGLNLTLHHYNTVKYQYNYGYINQNKDKLVDSKTMFGIGSVSKLFTTVALLQIQEKGILSLEDPINKYITNINDNRITIRMLLNHSSGLTGIHFKETFSNKIKDDYFDNLINFTNKEGTISTPGKFNVYCNDGFSLAQIIIETVTKQSFQEYLTDNIFIPLKMLNTSCPIEAFDALTYCHPEGPFELDYPQEYVNGVGTGGIYSTSHDLCLFLDGIINKTIINDSSYNAMINNEIITSFLPIDNTNRRYGLGFDCVKLELFKHLGLDAMSKGGATFGYIAQAIMVPQENLSISVVIATEDGQSSYVAQSVLYDYIINNMETKTIKQTLQPLVPSNNIDGVYGGYECNIYKVYNNTLEKYNSDTYSYELICDDLQELNGTYHSQKQPNLLDSKDGCIGFTTYQDNDYMYLEYTDSINDNIKHRILIAQKIKPSNTGMSLQLIDDTYIKVNEDIDQRTVSYAPIIFKVEQLKNYEDYLFYPYPLQIVSKTKAIPFVELPGDYSREMASVNILPDNTISNGDYRYQSIKTLPILPKNISLSNTDTAWFYIDSKIKMINTTNRGRIIALDKDYNLVYDSDLSNQPNYTVFKYIGFMGKDATFEIVE